LRISAKLFLGDRAGLFLRRGSTREVKKKPMAHVPISGLDKKNRRPAKRVKYLWYKGFAGFIEPLNSDILRHDDVSQATDERASPGRVHLPLRDKFTAMERRSIHRNRPRSTFYTFR
jgi:hypothetical protein